VSGRRERSNARPPAGRRTSRRPAGALRPPRSGVVDYDVVVHHFVLRRCYPTARPLTRMTGPRGPHHDARCPRCARAGPGATNPAPAHRGDGGERRLRRYRPGLLPGSAAVNRDSSKIDSAMSRRGVAWRGGSDPAFLAGAGVCESFWTIPPSRHTSGRPERAHRPHPRALATDTGTGDRDVQVEGVDSRSVVLGSRMP
jgi:hypothetical protein